MIHVRQRIKDAARPCVAFLVTTGEQCGQPTGTLGETVKDDGTIVATGEEGWGEVPLCQHHIRRFMDHYVKQLHIEHLELYQEVSRLRRRYNVLNTLEDDGVQETELPVIARYGRPHTMWRQPLFHRIVRRVQIDDDENGCSIQTVWGCGGSTTGAVTARDDIPTNCEECQRCVEAIDFHQRRAEQQQSPNRDEYQRRTEFISHVVDARESS